MNGHSEVFISYRRDGGEFIAKKLRDTLVKAHYHAFLDIEGLGSGNFNEHLLQAIDSCTDYILVLSKNSLDRCINDDDWVRREIEYAHSKGKHIITLVNKDFVFPESLPESCKFLTGDDIERIEYENLDDIPLLLKIFKERLKIHRHRFELFNTRVLPLIAAVVCVSLIFFAINSSIKNNKEKFPKADSDKILTEQVFNYIDANLSLVDKFSLDYINLLDSCIHIADNYRNADFSIPIEKIEALWCFMNTLDLKAYDFPVDFDSDLSNSHFNTESVKIFNTYISAEKDMLIKNIHYLATLFYCETQDDNDIIPSNKDYFIMLKEMLYDFNESYLLATNDALNPILYEYEPFVLFRKDVLSKYSTISFDNYEWLPTKELEKYLSAIISSMEDDKTSLQKQLNVEQDDIDKLTLKILLDKGLTRTDAIDLIEHKNALEIKKSTLTDKKLELALANYKFKQKLVYKDGDSDSRLEYKTRTAFTNGYYDVVNLNFKSFKQIYPEYIENISVIIETFSLFAQNYKKYKFDDILFVIDYSGNSENQKLFELGDIIISVNENTFNGFEEFMNMRSSGVTTIKVLRNKKGLLEEENITCEGKLGLELFWIEKV